MKRVAVQIFCLLLGAIFCQAQNAALEPPAMGNEQAKLAQAEQFAEKFLLRFYETLDWRLLKDDVAQRDETQLREEFENWYEENVARGLAAKLDRQTLEMSERALANFFFLTDIHYKLETAEKRDEVELLMIEQDILPQLKEKHNPFYHQLLVAFATNPKHFDLTSFEFFLATKEDVVALAEVNEVYSVALRKRIRVLAQDRKPQIEKLKSFINEHEEGCSNKKTYEITLDPDFMLMNPELYLIESKAGFKLCTIGLRDPT